MIKKFDIINRMQKNAVAKVLQAVLSEAETAKNFNQKIPFMDECWSFLAGEIYFSSALKRRIIIGMQGLPPSPSRYRDSSNTRQLIVLRSKFTSAT